MGNARGEISSGLCSFLFFLCAFIINVNSVFAGAWVPAENSGYHKFSYAYFEADDFFGQNDTFDEFQSQAITYYGEAGLGNNLGLFWSIPYQILEQTDSDGNQTEGEGIGDIEIGIRKQLISQPFVFSTSFTLKTPFAYEDDDELPLGNGQEDYELRFLFGKGLGKFGYVGIEGGYRLRSSDPSDEWRYLLEYGISASKNLYFRTKLDGIESVRNADVNANSANLAVNPEFDLGKWELTAGWNFDKANEKQEGNWGVEFTWTQDAFGDNALQGDRFELGFTYVH